MNMKKTIAAIAAGAVAVSAMATTVSAVESKTLSYNLTATLAKQNNGNITIKATFPNVPLTAGKDVTIRVSRPGTDGWNDKIVVSGQYIDTNKAINPITYCRDKWSADYSYAVTSGFYSKDATDTWQTWIGKTSDYGHVITIPVKAVNDGTPALIGGTATEAVAPVAASAVATATAIAGNPSATVTGIKVQSAAFAGMADGTYTLKYDGADWVLQDAEGFDTAVKPQVSGADAAAITGDTITVKYTAPVAGVEASSGVQMANITVTATLKNVNFGETWSADAGNAIEAGRLGIMINTNGVVDVTDNDDFAKGDTTYSNLTAATNYKMPFRTTLNDNIDIISYLETAKVVGDDKSYVNVKAVINDAIENYEGVTFTFNTAVGKVKYAVASGSKANPTIKSIHAKYDDAYKAAGSGDFVTAVYNDDSDAVDAYTAFGEHTYDWFYAPETTGFTGYDWGGTNLFAGALVVNESYTMSLSNTEYFDWTKTSVSFDWEAIMDNAATTNNYATYVHSLKLATSNLWFWDSMDLVLTAGEADDVSADAGVEADEDILDDEDDEVIDGEDDEDLAPVDDEEDEEPAPVVDEPAPAPVVSNPSTGNASVALAVIPVALAAAAIVAKKRG